MKVRPLAGFGEGRLAGWEKDQKAGGSLRFGIADKDIN
jgi:hypothetical protein